MKKKMPIYIVAYMHKVLIILFFLVKRKSYEVFHTFIAKTVDR